MSTFSNYKLFEAVSVRASDDKLVFLNTSNNNISLYSSNGSSTDVDTLSIKNIMNKSTGIDDALNICSYDGSTVSPMITIKYNTGIIYKKENLKKIGEYNLQYSISSDTDYIIRLLSNINLNLNSNAINLNQFICFMETGGASNKVNNIISKIKQDTKILIEHFGLRIINLYPMKIFSKFKNFTRKNKLFYELKLKLLIENLED